MLSKETNFPVAISLLMLCLALTIAWKLYRPDMLVELWPEMAGLTMDVLFILVIFALFEHRRAQVQYIARQRETIDDYKRWDHPEAQVRMAGAIRRLNKLGLFAIDFSALHLSDFSFAKQGIGRLSSSRFYEGSWGEPLQETGVQLTRVSFDHVDCSEVEFSPFDPLEALGADMPRYAKFLDCTFIDACLRGASFNGAQVEWSNQAPPSRYEVSDEDEEGTPCFVQSSYGPFDRANLAGSSFRACRFKNVDFRNADGIIEADFFRATGLETAVFDTYEIKVAILANANRVER